jgi:hypothetical protein
LPTCSYVFVRVRILTTGAEFAHVDSWTAFRTHYRRARSASSERVVIVRETTVCRTPLGRDQVQRNQRASPGRDSPLWARTLAEATEAGAEQGERRGGVNHQHDSVAGDEQRRREARHLQDRGGARASPARSDPKTTAATARSATTP